MTSVSTKLLGFVLLPVYTRYFTPEAVGTLYIYESIGKLLVVAISLYLDAAFVRFYFGVKSENLRNMTSFFSSHFWFVLVWGGLTSALLCVSLEKFIPGLPPANYLVVPALVLSQLFAQLVVMLTSVWAADLNVKKIAVFTLGFSIIAFMLTLYLIIFRQVNWEARVFALTLVGALQLSTITWLSFKYGWLRFRFDIEWIVQSLKFSVPLIPNAVGVGVVMLSDKFILSYYGVLDQVGVYSIAAQFALILYVVNDSVTKIQGSLAMSGMTADVNQAKLKIADFVNIYIPSMLIVFVFVSSLMPLIVTSFFDEQYVEAIEIFMILGWVYVLSGIYRVFTHVIAFHGATWIISTGAIGQALVNVALNLVLIPYYGMYAAACSTVIGMCFYTYWLAWWSQRLEKIVFDYTRISRYFFVGLAGIFSLFVSGEFLAGELYSLIIRSVIFLLFVSAMYLLLPPTVKLAILKFLQRA